MKATAFGIKEYQHSFSGATKLKGIVNFGGGARLKVWEEDLHKQCLLIAQFPPHEIRYEFRRSEKWGDSLTKIESTKSDGELMSLARERDERSGPAYAKAGSYLGRQISKKVQKHIDRRKGTAA